MKNNLAGNYYLTGDIDCSATSSWNSGQGFVPIGASDTPFTGTFNGNGSKIENLYINRPETDFVGLFGYVELGTIENVGLIDNNCKGKDSVGGLVGYLNHSTITNSYSTGSVNGEAWIGGLVGTVANSTITNSSSTGYVSGNMVVGGLVGYNLFEINSSYSSASVSGTDHVGGLVGSNKSSTITDSYSTGTVSGGQNVGGLVGQNENSTITDSYSTGSVIGGDMVVGGLVGYNYDSSTITNSYSTASVNNIANVIFVGGLVGRNNKSSIIENCYSTGSINSPDGNSIGGLVGVNEYTGNSNEASSIKNSYSKSSVNNLPDGGSYIGGLVGRNDHYSDIINSYSTGSVIGRDSAGGGLVGRRGNYETIIGYWDTETSGLSTSDAGVGKTTAEMKTQSTFSGWDFTNVWCIYEGIDYPYLKVSGGCPPSPVPTCTGGCAVLNGTVCVADDSYCSDETPVCSLSGNNGTCECNTSSCNTGSQCSSGSCVTCSISGTETCPTCGIDTPYWRSSACKACSETSGLTGLCTTAGKTCDASYNCVNCTAGIQCTCDEGQIADETGGCVLAAISISNCTQLQAMSSNLSGSYYLTGDIDCSETSTWNSGAGFEPIGTFPDSFTGEFDGKEYNITGLTIDRPETDYVGLFGNINGATIKDVGLENVDITGKNWVGALVGSNDSSSITNSYSTGAVTGKNGVGGLVGYTESSTIESCYSTGAVTGSVSYIGGLVGSNSSSSITNSYSTGIINGSDKVGGLVGLNSSSVTNSYATGSVSGTSAVGGLVGWTSSSGNITNSYSTGAVSGSSFVGGLVGNNSASTITNSYSTGAVNSSSGQYSGGLVGNNGSSSTITTSYSTGAVSGSSYVGGLAGQNDGSITNSYSTGIVNGNERVGGLVGFNRNSSVTNSYSTGAVSGSTYVGGLVGKEDNATTTNSYWNTETSGISTGAGGTGKTTAQMKTQSTFSGWDFDNIFEYQSNCYPRLKGLNNDFVCPLLTCTGCAVLSGGVCVAGGSCSGEEPNCIVSGNNGTCECSTSSCDAGRSCSSGACSNCASSAACGSCGCASKQKPTGSGSCANSNDCCSGECGIANSPTTCSYDDDLCPDGDCNRSTLACCPSYAPYWRTSNCRACTTTSGLSGACTTKGQECNSNYNCVNCLADTQCTCDAGQVADGSGACVTPACLSNVNCGIDTCVNVGKNNAFCSTCSASSQVWANGGCESCPANSTYSVGVCICSEGKIWKSSTNTCSNRGIATSTGDRELKRSTASPSGSRYDNIKNKMNRIKNKLSGGVGGIAD